MNKSNAVQDWLQFESIFENGIIKLKDSSYIKIIKVYPINYNLKTELEKEAILDSYKRFFQSCNFNLQVLIQSKKEDLSKNINKIKKLSNNIEISKKYIEYIQNLNKSKKSSNKNFYIIIKSFTLDQNINKNIENLQENYNKIKDWLSRCGNIISEYTNENQIKEILVSVFNPYSI